MKDKFQFFTIIKKSHSLESGSTNNRYKTTYRDVQNKPLFPCGFGFSYTTYYYSEIASSTDKMTKNGTIKVTNTRKLKGREIVQLYLHDQVCSVTRTSKDLKYFVILDLEPGETKTAIFEITPKQLEYISIDYKNKMENGNFTSFFGKI
ncbi:fibronectin type III-like domain-contianing protein [Flavobacterium saccharophilum]|uniref:fibronectin type III-like domain-contianing protein n=1 Tax=Flavobacterium saccharophilum TaxID=29534 RepID=UPI000932AF3C|nr:fibronectin type III-like domain-contianing protein [Flavobacterium saccharophilum]